MPEKETFQICWPKEVGEAFSRFSSQVGKAMSYKRESCQVKRSEKTIKGKVKG